MSEACTICAASFGSPADLMAHRRTAHKNADPSADVEMNPEAHTPGLLCALCGERFLTAQGLADHNLRPHRPSRPARGRRPTPM